MTGDLNTVYCHSEYILNTLTGEKPFDKFLSLHDPLFPLIVHYEEPQSGWEMRVLKPPLPRSPQLHNAIASSQDNNNKKQNKEKNPTTWLAESWGKERGHVEASRISWDTGSPHRPQLRRLLARTRRAGAGK